MPTPTLAPPRPLSAASAHATLVEAIGANRDRLRRLATRMLGDRDAAEDAVQDACVRAFQAVDRFRGDASMGTWLYRITVRACLDVRRRQRPVPVDPTTGTMERSADADLSDSIAARIDLARALASLPEAQRTAILLTERWGADYAEAASLLGVPVGTVASRVHRARQGIRGRLTAA